MIVRLRCGESYNFLNVKYIEDQGNIVEIKGNYKYRGKYITVRLYKISIENWKEIRNKYKVSQQAYYCKKCKVLHKSGQIYNDHREHIVVADDIPHKKIFEYDPTRLRRVAKAQIIKLIKRMDMNPARAAMYRREINKLLIYEGMVRL